MTITVHHTAEPEPLNARPPSRRVRRAGKAAFACVFPHLARPHDAGRRYFNFFLTLLFATISASTFAQNLPLPSRSTNALDGDAFGRAILTLDLGARNKAIADEFLAGNVPDFLRTFCPVTVTNVSDGVTNVGTFFVAPDYLAIGADTNYLFAPVSPDTAQRIADRLACTLPTRKMVDAIDAAATVKLEPSPIPPSAAMTSVAVFIQYNQTVWAQRMALTNRCPPGVLVAGDKKDLVLTRRLARATNNVAIYGWHHTNGAPVQPLFCGHAWWWVDYSQGVRLVSRMMLVNGAEKSVADVLADPNLCGLISDEGVITNARYATNFAWPDKISLPWPEITTLDGVRIFVDAPASALESFSANQPVELVFYALPNGNTIEETIGKKLAQGDDWHFDIQHIGAQTQWLRNVITNKAIVVAYLEANTKSWPAWRRTHFDSDRRIAQIVDEVSAIFPSNRTEVVLASHSGGGSCVFGYLNAMDEIPAKVSRIAFLDSDYAYDSKLHAKKIINWLAASADHRLCVLAYQDYLGLLNGKPFVSEAGGTWGRSRAMLADLAKQFSFGSETNTGLEIYSTKDRQVEFLLKENPEHKILHTVQVERNGFIQAMLSGTDWEGRGYEYLGARVYGQR